jgi:hypothetical protein
MWQVVPFVSILAHVLDAERKVIFAPFALITSIDVLVEELTLVLPPLLLSREGRTTHGNPLPRENTWSQRT